MIKFFYFLRGYSVVEICGAAPGWALNKIADSKIAFWDICQVDPMTVQVKVFRGREQQVTRMAESAMCDCRVVESSGVFKLVDKICNRPVLMISLLCSVLAALILPCFIFTFEVVGNETIPEQKILQTLDDMGVRFGTFGPNIYPRRVRDLMIAAIPELQWVTVVQNGCRARIVVRERGEVPLLEKRKGFSNIVASQSGIITKRSVYLGQPMCEVGDIVAKGDILVSGVVDLDRTYLLEPANAEIFARTWREISACIPMKYRAKREVKDRSRCLWIILGSRRIKIFGNSGISYGSCDKMIDTKTLTLPQGLSLPLSVVTETFVIYEDATAEMVQADAKRLLAEYIELNTEQQMIAGEILKKSGAIEKCNGVYLLKSSLECHEMIARVVEAKWNYEDFVND